MVSCQQGTTESDCVLAKELKDHDVPFLSLADSNVEARVLYKVTCVAWTRTESETLTEVYSIGWGALCHSVGVSGGQGRQATT